MKYTQKRKGTWYVVRPQYASYHYYCYYYFILLSPTHIIELLKTAAVQMSEISPMRYLGFRLDGVSTLQPYSPVDYN